MMDNLELIRLAVEARNNAYCPYSGFAVGAALLAADGSVFTGCNIESASFSPSICAERTAVFKAVSQGKRGFLRIAVVGGKAGHGISDYCPPCGVCRQVLSEFCSKDFEIILAKSESEYITETLGGLLPMSFEKDML